MTSQVAKLLFLGIALCAPALCAQANAPQRNPIDFAAARDDATRSQTGGVAAVNDADARRSAAAQTDYLVWSLEYRRATFKWQYYSTIVIFIAVMTMIGCGLYFSYMQFRSAKSAPTQTSIKVSREGLEISSPVIGLLILFISMGFFYLYLANVYPITEVVGANSAQAQTQPAASQ